MRVRSRVRSSRPRLASLVQADEAVYIVLHAQESLQTRSHSIFIPILPLNKAKSWTTLTKHLPQIPDETSYAPDAAIGVDFEPTYALDDQQSPPVDRPGPYEVYESPVISSIEDKGINRANSRKKRKAEATANGSLLAKKLRATVNEDNDESVADEAPHRQISVGREKLPAAQNRSKQKQTKSGPAPKLPTHQRQQLDQMVK